VKRTRYRVNIKKLDQLTVEQRKELLPVVHRYKFRANDYYLGLIDWNDPDDPIRRIIIPRTEELDDFGRLDASNEETNYAAPGCQHKYADTALLLCNEVCGSYCRFCFRKRLFQDDNHEVMYDVSEGIDYIRRTPQISNVLLTGGDPLMLPTEQLDNILRQLREIDHVRIIRLGSKMPAFNPYRIIDDEELQQLLKLYSTPKKRIYVMCHFNHPNELTDVARQGLDLLMQLGVMTVNQSPIVGGINDNPRVLAELMRELSFIGVPPYYFFQCRPTEGNKPFDIPIARSYAVLEEAKRSVSGLAKRARLVMSHELGKVEVVGMTSEHVYLRFHRARYLEDEGRFMVCHRNDEAFWLDELEMADGSTHPCRQVREQHQPAFALNT
jgi:KamA family protein